jgi:hypothetical protein
MDTTLAALFANQDQPTEGTVTAVTHQDIVVAFSLALKEQKVAILHMLYPRTDARTHRSLDSLVAKLHGHGMHEVARLIAEETHYLVFDGPAQARKALNEIRNDSLAIGAHLYYRGFVGEAAEQAIESDCRGEESATATAA